MAAKEGSLRLPHRRLARIRCLNDCIKAFKHNQSLPEALCYVPKQMEFVGAANTTLQMYMSPSTSTSNLLAPKILTSSGSATPIPSTRGTPLIIFDSSVCKTKESLSCRVWASGEEYSNSSGRWIRLFKYEVSGHKETSLSFEQDAWVLLYNVEKREEPIALVPVNSTRKDPVEEKTGKNSLSFINKQPRKLENYEDVIEYQYSLHKNHLDELAEPDPAAVKRIQDPPQNWTTDCDTELVRFLSELTEPENDNLGSIKNYVESIDVSSFCEESENITDEDPDTYWESDGSQGQHWLRLKMRKGTIIKKLYLCLDGEDGNYLPYHVIVMGGEIDDMKKLNDTYLDTSFAQIQDMCILQDMTEHYPYIEIRIKECKDGGIDVRVHGLKIKSNKERDAGLNIDLFSAETLVRYPVLESFTREVLYRRAILLQRFVSILDSVLPYLLPAWDYSLGSFASLDAVHQFLPLSKKRSGLVDTLLKESESGRPNTMPKLFIDRRAATEHKEDPSQDPTCKNTVFMQIYEGLKPKNHQEKALDYRWSGRYNQWWECKFLAEGIIDQGGGFRDSLSDLADELCPSASDVPVPLPYFVRAPNQSHEDSNVNRDVYVPNPACNDFVKYRWIGQLMGACFRGKESLVISLSSFTWKQMSGETVTWSRDFSCVDAAEVKLIDTMESMDKDTFDAHLADDLTWSIVRSDGVTIPLKENGANVKVTFDDRLEYIRLVQDARMNESNEQTKAMRQGLLEVVPEAVLQLLTWQELEKRVCGDSDITVEALMRSTHYEDLESTDTRVKYLWSAMGNFCNEDRSRFLRFVTGRRRLPASLYMCPVADSESIDSLPESSTCSNTLFLPNYSSAKAAEEKLRYAVYNCIAIDADMSHLDEW
ncbi:E3 ubiquitin-protein ligase HECTD3-like isoform X2 [Lineus longissimus]|uniref:E3 ubiquitin-protein ligase HECTD3-like isoform X2 n=1 Tax=Lineus longissimus TaxID=88925 RepID=UPI00315CF3A9